jgi:hypothetical protein
MEGIKKLIDTALSNGTISLSEIVPCFPETERGKVEELYKRIKQDSNDDFRNLVFLISVTENYQDKSAALDFLLRKAIPVYGDWKNNFDFKEFYEQQKNLYKNQDSIGGLSRVEELIANEFSSFGYGFHQHSPGTKDDYPPGWDNTVRAIEDGIDLD